MNAVVQMLINRYGKDKPLTLEHLRITLDIAGRLEDIAENKREREIAEALDSWQEGSPGLKGGD